MIAIPETDFSGRQPALTSRLAAALLGCLAVLAVLAACGEADEATDDAAPDSSETTQAADAVASGLGSGLGDSSHFGSYTLSDEEFGTEVAVTVNDTSRVIVTAETVTCASGETYRVEGLQDMYDLGMDFNNAHVQPTGEYHYHGVSQLMVDIYDADADLVHVGFAADGHLVYYSKSGAYASSYRLSSEPRTGSDCVGSGALRTAAVEVDGTAPDRTCTSGWAFDQSQGDLDSCNGITIDGQYLYLMTDEFSLHLPLPQR